MTKITAIAPVVRPGTWCNIILAWFLTDVTHVHVRYLLSPVLLSVCRLSVCLSVTFVRSTQAVQIFSNISKALGTLAIR